MMGRLKHVERLTEIKKLRKGASCWLYSANIDDQLFTWSMDYVKFRQLSVRTEENQQDIRLASAPTQPLRNKTAL